ncbi:MAG: endolytic transglycosylase MltG [Chloroflexi bacterium]|nr:endolytic transglycosylase MltG [Chloroflexota bacterium]NOG62259.1 endolytic transglycosylase MltG [Chloroflexota bacterium]
MKNNLLTRFASLLPGWAWFGLVVALTSAITMGIIAGVVVSNDKNDPSDIEVEENPLPVVMDVTRLPTFTSLPSHTPTQTASPTITQTLTQAPPTVIAQISTVSTPVPTATLLPVTSATVTCPHPDGWVSHMVQEGDTLFAFQLGAGRAGSPTTVDEILAANCLTSSFLTIGQTLWLPPGAADQAPPSQPIVAGLPAGTKRTPNCPCTIEVKSGWRLEQIADALNSTPVAFTGADFMAVTGRSAAIPPRDFLSSVPAGSGLEGFMFPGTYTLQNDTTAEAFRNMMLDAFGANASGLAAPGYTLYQTVILASIIQREVNMPSEQPTVSSVFHNRLASGKGLGATVTLMYGLGTSGNWWPHICCGMTDIDIPYNTNLHAGLTPTPISNPGLTALQAAANPAQTGYMYFTSRCDGTGIAYSVTYEEHLANVTCGQ